MLFVSPFLQYNSSKEAKENKENTDGGAGPGGGPEATPQSLVGCLTALCSANGLAPEDAFFIAQDSLIASNHPAIGLYKTLLLNAVSYLCVFCTHVFVNYGSCGCP